MKIEVLVATMTGNAHLVAQEIELTYADEGTHINVQLMDNLLPPVFDDRESVFLICTSTYGQGDVPDNGQPLYDALCEQRPDLSHVRFGILGLGDMTYADTFNHGGMRFETILTELGAAQIGTRATLDATGGELPEDEGVAWAESWLEQVREQHPA